MSEANETSAERILHVVASISTVGLYRKALAWLARGALVTRAASERASERAASLACGVHTIVRAMRCDVWRGVVLCCLVSTILSPSRSLRTSLTSTRWRWVVDAPTAAPFDLPGHAPFFHFFFHSLKGRWTKCIVKWAARSERQRRWEGERECAGGGGGGASERRGERGKE